MFSGCQTSGHQETKQLEAKFNGSYQSNVLGMLSLQTYDHYTRTLTSGYGFYISPTLIVCPFNLVQGAHRIKSAPLQTTTFTDIKGFVAYSLSQNCVLLETANKNKNFIPIGKNIIQPDTVYQLLRKNNQLFVFKTNITTSAIVDSITYWSTGSQLDEGKPVFSLNHQLVGIVVDKDGQNRILPANNLTGLIMHKSDKAQAIYDLRTKTTKIYPNYKTIKAFRIVTNMGNIEMTLFDETPEYRDNFIKLVSDHYYDSLLVHRVIRDFLIQTGALDSKNAEKDDVVGWLGPGYTLPMKISPQLFHKRGMVAASKLPADRNPHNRSDGAQFYIVSGRVFSEDELNTMEKKRGVKFTPEQRLIYTTKGGAPYLDGDYTVFAQVSKGMDVVDKIASVETYNVDRPIDEVRIRTIEIIKR